MTASMSVKIEGLDKALKKLGNPNVKTFAKTRLEQAGAVLEGAAKPLAPVDTGVLRASITHAYEEVGSDFRELLGSAKSYAPYMEFGTGTQSDFPGAPHHRHRPPAGALDRWAYLHGIESGFVVARAIGRRGGLRPRRFLRNAWEQNQGRIADILVKILADIRQHLAD